MNNYHEDLILLEMEEYFEEIKKTEEINKKLLEFSCENIECYE